MPRHGWGWRWSGDHLGLYGKVEAREPDSPLPVAAVAAAAVRGALHAPRESAPRSPHGDVTPGVSFRVQRLVARRRWSFGDATWLVLFAGMSNGTGDANC